MGGDRAQLGREGAAIPVQHQESVHWQCDTRNRPPAEKEVRMVSTVRLLLLDLFNTELSPERYWHGLRSWGVVEVGGGGEFYMQCYSVTARRILHESGQQ